jgi:hypothetical protein
MKVFSPDYVARIDAAYNRMPEHLRPLLYRVVCAPENAELRAEIEEYVADLHLDDARRSIERLQESHDQGPAFQNTYHELVAGYLLREQGFLPRYDPTILIDGKERTPDWDVPATPRSPRFLCDVFTVNPEQQRARREADVRDLTTRLGAIPIGVALLMQQDTSTVYDAKQNAATVRAIERWLRDEAVEGAAFSAGGFTFSVIAVSSSYTHVQFLAPMTSFWVAEDPLVKTIEEKVSKYRGAGLPIVIAVFADFLTGVGAEEVQRAISGDGRRAGVFSRESLSAVLWITRATGTWTVRPFCNPAARIPLSEDLFATAVPI